MEHTFLDSDESGVIAMSVDVAAEVSVAGLAQNASEILPELLGEELPGAPRLEPAIKQIARPEQAITSILSARPGHAYYAQPIVQQKVVLGDNGVLYLAEDAMRDILVMDYVAMLDRRKALSDGRVVPYKTTRTVPYSELQRLNAQLAGADELSEIDIARKTAEESEVISIIAEGAKLQASDIFFEIPYRGDAEIHYRIAGDIERRFRIKPERMKRLIRTIFESMCEARSDPYYDPTRDQTARIASVFLEGLGLHRCRVSTGPTEEDRPLLQLRLHYDMGEPRSLIELGYTQQHQDLLYDAASYPYGFILFTGPTGCGKSTTLNNIVGYLQILNRFRNKIYALEDPNEMPYVGAIAKNISRNGAGREVEELAWVQAGETILRWNPNWVIFGELRLRATMEVALTSALTNHLTWGSLHASSATIAPVRLQEAGIEMGFLCDPEIFRLFANQSLAAQVCPACSVPYEQGAAKLQAGLRRRVEALCMPETVRLRNPQGCSLCHRGALRLRTLCAEVMATDEKLMKVFRDEGEHAMRKFWVHERGGMTKTSHAIAKINQGLIDPSDAERMVSPLDADRNLKQ